MSNKIDTPVYAFAGPLGTGKTLAMSIVDEEYDNAFTDEMSNFVRHEYDRQNDDETDDNGLGAWAAEEKDEHGDGCFADGWANMVYSDIRATEETGQGQEWDAVAISGLRSPAELDALNKYFSDVTCITIWTMRDMRYERTVARDDDMDHDTFYERNKRELVEWDCLTYYTDEDYYDYIVPNNHSDIEKFERDIRLCVNGNKIADSFRSTPFPSGLPKENVLQYV